MALTLRNPHAVLAVLDTRPNDVVELRLSSRKPGGAWNDVAERAVHSRVPVTYSGREQRNSRRGKPNDAGGRSGGSSATVKARNDLSVQQLLASDDASNAPLIALDRIQDPHNVGAIFRTAAFFGIRGAILTKDQSAPLNATVYDVASGGMEYVPFHVATNLGRALDAAKEAGLWILGTSERAQTDIVEIPHDRPWLIALGNEERGLRRLTEEHCDMVCRITPRSPVGSLNVSVAAGILMSHFSPREP